MKIILTEKASELLTDRLSATLVLAKKVQVHSIRLNEVETALLKAKVTLRENHPNAALDSSAAMKIAAANIQIEKLQDMLQEAHQELSRSMKYVNESMSNTSRTALREVRGILMASLVDEVDEALKPFTPERHIRRDHAGMTFAAGQIEIYCTCFSLNPENSSAADHVKALIKLGEKLQLLLTGETGMDLRCQDESKPQG